MSLKHWLKMRAIRRWSFVALDGVSGLRYNNEKLVGNDS